MATKLTRLAHKIEIKLHLVAESCTICIFRSRRPVRKLLDTPSYDEEREVVRRKKRINKSSGNVLENWGTICWTLCSTRAKKKMFCYLYLICLSRPFIPLSVRVMCLYAMHVCRYHAARACKWYRDLPACLYDTLQYCCHATRPQTAESTTVLSRVVTQLSVANSTQQSFRS